MGQIMRKSFKTVLLQPALMIPLMITVFLIRMVDMFIPGGGIFSSLYKLFFVGESVGQDIRLFSGNFIKFVQYCVSSKPMLFLIVAAIFAASLLIAFAFALLTSGYMNMIRAVVEKAGLNLQVFNGGVRYSYIQQLRLGLIALPCVAAMLIICTVSLFPATFITYSVFAGYTHFALIMVLLDLATLVIVFLAAVYFQIYLLSWLIVLAVENNGVRNAFKAAGKFVPKFFWELFRSVFWVNLSVLLYIGLMNVLRLAIGGIVPTTGFSFGGLLFAVMDVIFVSFAVSALCVHFFSQYNSNRNI